MTTCTICQERPATVQLSAGPVCADCEAVVRQVAAQKLAAALDAMRDMAEAEAA